MIRPQSPLVDEYTYVSLFDDALDREAPDFAQRWQEYLDGTAEPPIKAGGTPTVFHLRHLRAKEMNELMRAGANGYDLARRAITGISGQQVDGYKFALVKEGDHKVANLDAAPDLLWPVFTEVGGRVLARATPSGK